MPTISTTFASFHNLFGYLGADSIGYLLVDEAGQSPPQAAAGAIYRAKKAIIVGDPLQIQPVVTIPKSINKVLLEYYNIEQECDILQESAQTLADTANEFGTYVDKSNNAQWVGCPLLVHRRCLEPMFGVSNFIAYGNKMIQATIFNKSFNEEIYPKSTWINVPASNFDGLWSHVEGKVVLQFLSKIIHATNTLPSLYIISPFKYVEHNMKKYLRSNLWQFKSALSSQQQAELQKWIRNSVGTIHSFQGKQADAVILLLGGDPDKPGAINWASDYPNILNVAITRAKNLLFVVGNHNIWSKKPHFQELSSALSTSTIEEILQEKIDV